MVDKAAKSYSVTVVVTEKLGGVDKGNEAKMVALADLADKLGDSHMNILPKKQLIVVLCSVSLGLLIAFADQTAVAVAMNDIGKDLNAQSSINWAGTASLLANTVCQVLFGRFSDIFGRKSVFLSCLMILAISDLACGFSQTGVQYFIFRAFAGIGQGGVSSLSMVMLSDVVTLKQRGKYQGILGTSVGIGNAVGPFIMAAFVSKTTWRDFYHLFAPLMMVIAVVIYYLVPDNKKAKGKEGNVLSRSEKFKKIDYLGLLSATISLTFILVPLSGGGSTYAWNSPLVIAMFVIGGVFFVAFLLIEWKIPELPMIPLRLFTNPLLCLILASNFLFGMVYYSVLFYIPYYFQIVRGLDEVKTSIFLLPIVLMQALWSTILGNVITYTGHYLPVVLFGYSCWTIGCGLLLIWNEQTKYGVCIACLLMIGIGIGCTFQPTMVAAQAQSKKADRAVVISTRNVIRSFGGSAGIAIASTIISNSLISSIDTIQQNPSRYANIPTNYLISLKSEIYSKIDTTQLNSEQVKIIQGVYMKSIRNYFYILLPFIGVCLLSSLFIRDRGLQCLDETPIENDKKDIESNEVHEVGNYSIRTSTDMTELSSFDDRVSRNQNQ